MLNMVKVELGLISDADMYLFFEKGMRDRVSYISKRYSIPNKKYLKSHNPKQESNYIIYLTRIIYMVMLSFFQQVDSNG